METICLYERDAKRGTIVALQRTATWVFPSDPRSAVLADLAQGQAVDVRTYRVVYTPIKENATPR